MCIHHGKVISWPRPQRLNILDILLLFIWENYIVYQDQSNTFSMVSLIKIGPSLADYNVHDAA